MKFVFVIGLMISMTYASSGRTNSGGCHTSKREGYHCHTFVNSNSGDLENTPNYTQTPVNMINHYTYKEVIQFAKNNAHEVPGNACYSNTHNIWLPCDLHQSIPKGDR